MKFKISTSALFKEQSHQIGDVEDTLVVKRIMQNIKSTALSLEHLEKKGLSIEKMILTTKVPQTKYAVVYKIINRPHKKIIAKKIRRL